jgi:hypothetical protein
MSICLGADCRGHTLLPSWSLAPPELATVVFIVRLMRDRPLPPAQHASAFLCSSLLSHRVLSRPQVPLLQHAAASSVVLSTSLMSPSEPCVHIADGWDDLAHVDLILGIGSSDPGCMTPAP